MGNFDEDLGITALTTPHFFSWSKVCGVAPA